MTTVHRLPFTMKTVFQDSFLLTFAVPPERLAALLPPCVHPYVRDGHSYVSILIANMRGMRPQGVPEFLGTNYYQIVYRAVVRLYDVEGREYPGVFFLRSDSNDPVMSFFGNRLTEFRFHYFHTGAINMVERNGDMLITVETRDKGGDLIAHLYTHGAADSLPPSAGFASVREEKDTLVQLFHAFAYDPERELVYDLEIERGEWRLQRLEMLDCFSAFFMEQPFTRIEAESVSSVYIHECSYIWKPMVVIPASHLRPRVAVTAEREFTSDESVLVS
jgi:uncharacterized protein YqjF (DUF2071 family)